MPVHVAQQPADHGLVVAGESHDLVVLAALAAVAHRASHHDTRGPLLGGTSYANQPGGRWFPVPAPRRLRAVMATSFGPPISQARHAGEMAGPRPAMTKAQVGEMK